MNANNQKRYCWYWRHEINSFQCTGGGEWCIAPFSTSINIQHFSFVFISSFHLFIWSDAHTALRDKILWKGELTRKFHSVWTLCSFQLGWKSLPNIVLPKSWSNIFHNYLIVFFSFLKVFHKYLPIIWGFSRNQKLLLYT